ncbi:hypothetical protein CEXT_210981 [Caerostris extrusa]|uniref:Uncharacterized protein n=1 Tax=Caerostris extrusa TaxID=172846 RepID=A0AAV4M5P1_CAEEX|nr:hypothetical protein CEXT_210981 [Caerostris extrusa]
MLISSSSGFKYSSPNESNHFSSRLDNASLRGHTSMGHHVDSPQFTEDSSKELKTKLTNTIKIAKPAASVDSSNSNIKRCEDLIDTKVHVHGNFFYSPAVELEKGYDSNVFNEIISPV